MKKIILIGLCILSVFLLSGAGYRFYLSQYEEVCTQYQMNVTAEFVKDYGDWCDFNGTCWSNKIYHHQYTQTNNCVEYQLIRKTNVTPFVYLFNFSEVYPEVYHINIT